DRIIARYLDLSNAEIDRIRKHNTKCMHDIEQRVSKLKSPITPAEYESSFKDCLAIYNNSSASLLRMLNGTQQDRLKAIMQDCNHDQALREVVMIRIGKHLSEAHIADQFSIIHPNIQKEFTADLLV